MVKDSATGLVSEPLHMRTASAGALHSTAYRIAEFTFEPDFLENHDAANKECMPIYVQNGGGVNETAKMAE